MILRDVAVPGKIKGRCDGVWFRRKRRQTLGQPGPYGVPSEGLAFGGRLGINLSESLGGAAAGAGSFPHKRDTRYSDFRV